MANYKPIDYSRYPEIFSEFGTFKTVVQNRSVNTVFDYLFDLAAFFRWLLFSRGVSDAEDPSGVDISGVDIALAGSVKKSEIYAFLNYELEHNGNRASARARKLSSIRAFYRYLYSDAHLIRENPVADISSPKIRAALPKFMTLEESQNLLSTVAHDEDGRQHVRDYAMITLFLNCGIRLSELCGLNTGDLDRELRSMRVLGKGSKERMVYLNDACKHALRDWLVERPAYLVSKEKNALFLSQRGNRISQKTVQWVVHKYLDSAGLGNRQLSVHKLRHTAATLMYQSGNVDVRVLKDILGHEQLNTTQIYTHISDAQMERAMQQNPLADGVDVPRRAVLPEEKANRRGRKKKEEAE